MSDVITNLHPKDDNTINLRPNIVSDNIPSNAVTTDKINDAAVTTAKIADAAVDNTKIADGSVYYQHLSDFLKPNVQFKSYYLDATITYGVTKTQRVSMQFIAPRSVINIASTTVATLGLLESLATTYANNTFDVHAVVNESGDNDAVAIQYIDDEENPRLVVILKGNTSERITAVSGTMYVKAYYS